MQKKHYPKYLKLREITNFANNDTGTGIDPISTGIGKRNIQYYATFFQHGNRQGWAEFPPTVSKNGYNYFIVKIFFPLWEDLTEENLKYA